MGTGLLTLHAPNSTVVHRAEACVSQRSCSAFAVVSGRDAESTTIYPWNAEAARRGLEATQQRSRAGRLIPVQPGGATATTASDVGFARTVAPVGQLRCVNGEYRSVDAHSFLTLSGSRTTSQIVGADGG